MSDFTKVFTDAVKDVIGNDPVLDQFDISYNASFYGSMQDDYVTGSLLDVQRGPRGSVLMTSGSRGRFFSKLLCDSQPQLSNVATSRDVQYIPQLSYRQVPWSDRVSKTFNRNIQCFDPSERYYDSCLPDLRNCFLENGSRLWTPSSGEYLSPRENFEEESLGFMFFNTVALDRSSSGFENDPTVNNEWTWSYPYEAKYEPTKRLLKTDESLGFNYSELRVDLTMALSSSLFNSWNTEVKNLIDLSEKPIKIKGIVPILPGRHDGTVLGSCGGRNSLRGVFSGSVPYNAKAIYGIDALMDSKTGVSFLIPADVNLGRYSAASELVTGSMTVDDTIKTLFGFGDLNNMTYANYDYTLTDNSYEQGFELPETNVTYYFWSASGTADNPKQTGGKDFALDRSKEGSVTTLTRSSNFGEFYDSGWHSLIVDPSSTDNADGGTSWGGGAVVWITDVLDPNVTQIPAGTWRIRVNASANEPIDMRALIYKWNGSLGVKTLIGTSSTVTIGTSWNYYTISWSIGSIIPLSPSDRILIKLQVNFTKANHSVYFTPRRTYFSTITRYSSVETNIPVTYDPDNLYTKSYELSSYLTDDLKVDWSKSPVTKPWAAVYRSGSTTIGSEDYNFWGPGPLSGTVDPSPNKRGLFGLSGENENFILFVSGTYEPSSPQEYSECYMDVTSSNPWTLSYDRAVAGRESFGLTTFITGTQFNASASPDGWILETVTGSNNGTNTPPPAKYHFDMFQTFDSGLQYGGSTNAPTTFPPGQWRIGFKAFWEGASSTYTNDFLMAGIDNVTVKTYSVAGDPNGPKIGGNNYPQFRTYRADPRANSAILEGTSLNQAATKVIHEANVFGVSPVIRGWKYGLYNGLPTNSKAIFRRGRFGQFRDMLEQRQYTKFVNIDDSPASDDATTESGFNKFTTSRLTRTTLSNEVGPSVVSVNFFKQRYRKDGRGIGTIYNEKVAPDLTTSQNLSSEVTSSLPYFDGEAKMRQESSLKLITDATLTSLQFNESGFTVI
jgi:hypothetical protein